MLSTNVIFIGALLITVLVLVGLRINAALVFLSLCLGYVLVQFVANDANSLVNFLVPNKTSLSGSSLRLIILFLPAVLTSVMMVFSIRGTIRMLINFLPAAGASVLGLLLGVPLLPHAASHNFESQKLWQDIHATQSFVVSISAAVSLLFLWSQRRHARKSEHGKHAH